MTRRPEPPAITAATALAAAVLLTALTGCNGDSQAAQIPSTSSTPTSATPSPTPTVTKAATPEEAAIAQAQQAVRNYYDIYNKVSLDPAASLALLKTVAISTGLITTNIIVNDGRAKKQRQTGTTEIASMQVNDVTLTNNPKNQPPQIPTVQIDVCYDVSGVKLVDASGKSVVAPTRKSRALARMGVTNYAWPNSKAWKVGWVEVKGEPCAGKA